MIPQQWSSVVCFILLLIELKVKQFLNIHTGIKFNYDVFIEKYRITNTANQRIIKFQT